MNHKPGKLNGIRNLNLEVPREGKLTGILRILGGGLYASTIH